MCVSGGGRGREAGGARNGGRGSSTDLSLGDHAAKAVVAGAALIADAAALEIANGFGAVGDGSVDVSFVFAAADADDHCVGPCT